MKKYPFTIEPLTTEDPTSAFLKAFEAILENPGYRSILDIYSRVSMNCTRCAQECQIYRVSRDPRDIPCYRSSLLLSVYRRHFTTAGRIKSRIFGTPAVSEQELYSIAESFYRCTLCGRCSRFCPMGIDHRIVVRLGRFIMSRVGIVPKALSVSVNEQIKGPARNTSAIPLKALKDNLEFLEEEIFELKGKRVRFPLDVRNAEYVFFAPVSDYLMEADTLMGIACVLHEAGVSWTISTEYFDAINYGLFYSDDVLETLVQSMFDEVRRIGGKKILIGECGHAFRVADMYLNNFTDRTGIPVVSMIDLTARLIKTGRIELDPDAVTERVTYHDPCNIARNGRLVEAPREIIASFIKNFVEMEPHGRLNLCCGGGGGTVSVNEFKPYRMAVSGKGKADQLISTGAELVITPCANCKKQIGELIAHHKVPMRHAGLHDLVFNAIRMNNSGEGD